MNDDDRNTPDLRQAFRERHARLRAILILTSLAVAVVLTTLLPIAWYWKIPAFFGVLWAIAMPQLFVAGYLRFARNRQFSK